MKKLLVAGVVVAGVGIAALVLGARVAPSSAPPASTVQAPKVVRHQPSPTQQRTGDARQRYVELHTQQVERLEHEREVALKAGKTAEVAMLDKQLARQRARIKVLKGEAAVPALQKAGAAATTSSAAPLP